MARKVEIVVSIRLEGGREVRQTTLNDNIQDGARRLIRDLSEQGYGVVDADVEWTSISDHQSARVLHGRRRRYTLAGLASAVGRRSRKTPDA